MYVGVKKVDLLERALCPPGDECAVVGDFFFFHYFDQANSAGFWECELYLPLKHAVYHQPPSSPALLSSMSVFGIERTSLYGKS